MKHRLTEFMTDESGATALEYGVAAAVVAVAVIGAMELLGTSLSNIFKAVAVVIDTAMVRS